MIIHRAVLGSLERMLAILIEHTGGKWPLWLSPRQVAVCPVAERHAESCANIEAVLRSSGIHAETLAADDTLGRLVAPSVSFP